DALAACQLTVVVRSCVEPSVWTPVAANCWRVPFATLGFAGVTPIDTSVAAVTVRVVEPESLARLAVMVTVPGLRVVPSPSYPEALLTAATVGSEVLQTAVRVRSCV